MSKKEIEYCNVCDKDTPHMIRHRLSKSGKKEFTNMSTYEHCLTCGTRETRGTKAKTVKHVSLRG